MRTDWNQDPEQRSVKKDLYISDQAEQGYIRHVTLEDFGYKTVGVGSSGVRKRFVCNMLFHFVYFDNVHFMINDTSWENCRTVEIAAINKSLYA